MLRSEEESRSLRSEIVDGGSTATEKAKGEILIQASCCPLKEPEDWLFSEWVDLIPGSHLRTPGRAADWADAQWANADQGR
jgi:hypothetical protein